MKRLVGCFVIIAFGAAVLAGQGVQQAPTAAADFVFPGQSASLPAPLKAALDGLRAPALGAHISMLASPSLEGRGVGSRGLDATAEYVAATLAIAGVRPVDPPAVPAESAGATASYFHAVPMREITHQAGQVVVEARHGEAVDSRAFLSSVDCLFPELPPETFAAPVVFAGYGIREQAPARDDYRDLDVKGRIVLVFGGLPPGPEWQAKDLAAKYGAESGRRRFAAKAELARSMGARAVLAIEGNAFPGVLASGDSAPAARFFVPFEQDSQQTPPVIRVSTRVGDALFATAGLTADAARSAHPRTLPGVSVSVRITGDERLAVSRNVAGMIQGADSTLRSHAVVIGAHMDHLGRNGETLYPGADDNASGVAALLEIAKTFAASKVKPRRTLIFVFWTGEEEGHLGSDYYARHPLWPLDRTAVYLNLDMIGHPWKPEEIRQLVADTHLDKGNEFLAKVKPDEFLELGVAEWAPDLGPVLMHAARGTGVALHLDRTDGKSGGSDYRAFARKGLPWVRFFGNYFDGYHEPTDTANAVDSEQVLRMARLAFASAWLLADR